ncbi:hypothetical protein [Cohnella soli]|uniref:Uncharacterized protein n=1 Tax=Cohnella soli TaxID=425005 RepID=A0ABW0I084_9BACL
MKWLNEIEKCFNEAAGNNFLVSSERSGREIHYWIDPLYEDSFLDTLDLFINLETRRARIVKEIDLVMYERENLTLKTAYNQLYRFIANADTVDEDIYS